MPRERWACSGPPMTEAEFIAQRIRAWVPTDVLITSGLSVRWHRSRFTELISIQLARCSLHVLYISEQGKIQGYAACGYKLTTRWADSVCFRLSLRLIRVIYMR
jgi:hypothetical protein